MKRPSNLIIGFILAVAGIFLAYGLGRMFFQVIQSPEIEVEEDYESRLHNFKNVLVELPLKSSAE